MKNKERVIVTLLTVLVLCFLSVGYAIYNANINVFGTISFGKNGKVAITNAVLSSYKNLNNPKNPNYDDVNISFDLNFTVAKNQAAFDKEYSATYDITITNNSFYDYSFSSSTFTPSLGTSNNDDMVVTYSFEGIDINEIISAGTSKTFKLVIIMYPNNYGDFNVSGDAGVNLEEKEDEGSILASIPKNSTGDLSGNNKKTKLIATVVNSYKTNQTFSFSVGNKNFYLVDKNGTPISSYTISANTTEQFEFYIMQKEGSKFPSDSQSMNVFIEQLDGAKTSMGVVVIKVDEDLTLTDDESPVVSNVIASFQEEKGSVLVQYTGYDNVGIKNYIIETYKVENDKKTLVSKNQTVSDEESFIVKNLSDGSYCFKVIANDLSGNSSFAESTTNNYKWTFKVTITITNGTPNETVTVDYDGTYTATLAGSGNRNPPATLTVKMDGNTIDSYTYSSNTGVLKIPNIKGDIEITGEARTTGCLLKGTKVKIANGEYKNIEDVGYDDLLLVWNYETGNITKEYPLWIENKHKTNQYTKITFSDNSIISVINAHSFFSCDENKFVDFKDNKKFHIGTCVSKLDKNDKIKKVYVSKIEEIEETVEYFFVASTRYYNIISNDFITTDGYTDITNLYDFNDKIKWINKKEKIINYSYLKDVLPYYMYKGFRVGELGVLLEKNNLTLKDFKQYLLKYIIDPDMLKAPIIKDNKRYWMVTNSLDNIKNKEKFLIKEGNYYKLPQNKNIKYWYSTSEHKYYYPGEKVKVYTAMHFEAVNN